MTDLSGSQISSLMETLPGIAQVLRSPVADAFIGLIRAGIKKGEFDLAHAEEVMRYAVRRNLLAADESEQIIAEAREAVGWRPPERKVAPRTAPPARKAEAKSVAKKPAAKSVAKKPVAKPVRKTAKVPARKAAKKGAKKVAKKAARKAAPRKTAAKKKK